MRFIRLDTQISKELVRFHGADNAEMSVAVMLQASVTQGDIPPQFSDSNVIQVDITAEMAVIDKHIGQAVIAMGKL